MFAAGLVESGWKSVLLGLLILSAYAEDPWWSWQELKRQELPKGDEEHVVDRFVARMLREKGLTPSGEADRRTLARRLAYDLWGMPLPPERVDRFVADEREGAYGELVDELLASPRYGERWARHWLDLVHFGETHGYDKDKPREHAWRYRDYVIRAFNEDKPYGRFVREQVAGDVLWPDTEDGMVAPGFLAAGPWDLIGHMEVPEDKIDGMVARHLDRDDMVTAVMNVFCSLTVQCAQCHDHKIDPVSMEDYYSLQSVFSALDRTNLEYDLDPEVAEKRQELRKKLRAAEDHLKALGCGSPGLGYHSEVADHDEEMKWVQVDLGREVNLGEIRFTGAREYGFEDFGFPHRFRVEVSSEADFRKATVLQDETSADFRRPGGEVVVIAGRQTPARHIRVVATKLWNRRRAGEALSNDWIFALGKLEAMADGRVVPSQAVTALDSIEALPRWGKANLLKKEDGDRVEAARLVDAIKEELGRLPAPRTAYVAKVHHGSGNFKGRGHLGGKPRAIHVLDRGDVTKPLQEVFPGTVPGLLGQSGEFDLPEDHAEGDRRVALANWLVDPAHPLTWRSIVNRVWQGHFGTGLVATANDFGRLGARPSHPALLDWLAVEFRDGGGSLKKLHRLIVTSRTYRQESRHHAVNASRDDSNRFLWRQNRRRLEAEALRDTVLLAAGKMNLSMGGPSFRDFVIEKPEHSPHYLYDKADPDDESTHRRSVYRFVVRSQPQPLMEALDCADPSLLVDKRGETTTAVQALAMMNHRFVTRMAEHFAKAIEGEGEIVDAALRKALGRRATDLERRTLGDYAGRHGVAAMCRLVFNLSEFSYVD